MWKGDIREHYPWAKIQSQMDELIYELSRAEDEEGAELIQLQLHLDDKTDLGFFTQEEAEMIASLLSVLIGDTMKHQNLLGNAIKDLKEKKIEEWKDEPEHDAA